MEEYKEAEDSINKMEITGNVNDIQACERLEYLPYELLKGHK